MERLFTVSTQQLAFKLCGCRPDVQFANQSTTCPISAMLTYLLEQYEFALEIIYQCILMTKTSKTENSFGGVGQLIFPLICTPYCGYLCSSKQFKGAYKKCKKLQHEPSDAVSKL